jgi:hypothetical protein
MLLMRGCICCFIDGLDSGYRVGVRIFSFTGLALAATLSISQACTSSASEASEAPPERPTEAVEQPPEPSPEPVLPVAPEPVPPEPVQPEEAPEQVAANYPPLDNTCKADDDCLPAPSCCPTPCTPNVINRNQMAEAQRRLKELCPEILECGNAGGCRTHEYLCVEGTCALVYAGDKGYRKRKSQ